MHNNQIDLKTVISYLEESFQKLLLDRTLITNDARFVEALKTWDIIVRFAHAHNCMLPGALPKYLADHDLWFEFVAVSHIFDYPTKQVCLKMTMLINILIGLIMCCTSKNHKLLFKRSLLKSLIKHK